MDVCEMCIRYSSGGVGGGGLGGGMELKHVGARDW